MRNESGLYEVTRFMKSTGALLRGSGKTALAARQSLANEVSKYNEALRLGLYFQPTGEKVISPGVVTMTTPSGTVLLRQDDRREIAVFARPDVAKYIQDGRRSNYTRETRQIRRARERA